MSRNVLHLQRLPELNALGLGAAFVNPTVQEPSCTVCSYTCASTAEE